jgi:Zn-dependent protease with chaperone function
MPEIKLGPKGAQDGQAFGFRNLPFLRLGSGLKAMRLYPEHLAEYKAVIFHELAHIKNDDVQRSYFGEAVWKTLLIIALPLVLLISLSAIPLYYSGRFDTTITRFSPIFALLTAMLTAIYLLIIMGLMVGVLHFIRRGALRVREIYADWRAAQWGGMDGLVSILGNAKSEQLSFWQRLVRAHPRFEDRLNALRDPYLLFRVSPDLPLINGLLLGFAFGGAGMLIGLVQVSRVVGSASLVTFLFALLGIVVFTALFWLLSSTLGLQIQREAVADLARNVHGLMPYLRLFPLALLFHIGIEAALILMPYENLQVGLLAKGLAATLVFPFWILGISTMTWLWMCAIRFFARRWVGSRTGAQIPTFEVNLLTILAVPVLPMLYFPFMQVRGWPAVGQENLLSALIGSIVSSGIFIAFCLVCWLFISFIFPPKCPHCGTNQMRGKTVGRVCTECGGELSRGLFVD